MHIMRCSKRRLKRLSIVPFTCIYLAALSLSPVISRVTASQGVILPPPPPPPPQKHSISLEGSKTKEDSDAESKAPDPEKSVGNAPTEPTGEKSVDDTSKAIRPIRPNRDNYADLGENTGGIESKAREGMTEQKKEQQPILQPFDAGQRPPEHGMWGSEHPTSQPMQYYDQQQWIQQQQWQQQQQQQQSLYQDNRQTQQQYYQQQPYGPQYTQRTQQQSGQMTLYRRSPPQTPSPALKTAHNIFSLARKKLQTGIESVSETLDASKVGSSVSKFTSRIGGSVTGSGRSYPPRPRATAMGGSSMDSGVRGAGEMGTSPQRSQHPQRMFSDPGRRRPAKKEAYAPPISELYSLGQSQSPEYAKDDLNVSVVDAGDGADFSHDAEMDTTDGEHEDDASYGTVQQKQSTPPKEQTSTSGPSLSRRPPYEAQFGTRISQSQQVRTEPKPRSRPLHRQYSSAPLRPQNGGSMTPPSNASRRRQYQDDDDDDYGSSFGHKMKSALGACVPRVPRLFKRSDDMAYDDGAWSDDEGSSSGPRSGFFSGGSKAKDVSLNSLSSRRSQSSSKSVVVPRPVQSLLEKRERLLSDASFKKCASIGRSQAVLDASQIAMLTYILHEVVPLFFNAISSSPKDEFTNVGVGNNSRIRQAIVSTVLAALDGWAPHACVAAILLSASDRVWIQPALESVFNEAASENASDAAYTQLYLRLISSLPMRNSFSSEAMKKTAQAQAMQIASSSRLRCFVTIAVLYVLLSTVAVLRPMGSALSSAAAKLIQLPAWRELPIDWKNMFGDMKDITLSLAGSLREQLVTEFNLVQQQPLRVAVVVSLCVALSAVSMLPSLEKKRVRRGVAEGEGVKGLNEEDVDEASESITSLWSNFGSSSAARLCLLSSPRGVEGALEQFAKLRPDDATAAGIASPGDPPRPMKEASGSRHRKSLVYLRSSFQPLVQKVLYTASSISLLLAPFSIYFYLFANAKGGESSIMSVESIPEHGWGPLLELAMLLAFTHVKLVGNAVNAAIEANKVQLGYSVTTFFAKLEETINELQALAAESSSGADFQAMLTASPTKGIAVSDLWTAHSSRRAWATKGANVQVKNGEVVLIIGADGAGKSRLLTSIAEHIFVPPKNARTTTYVRGSISIAGVDRSKWDRSQLQKRVGVFLHDVRTVCDHASLMSGCTIEEILEPVPLEGSRIGPKERNSMLMAMKITGLGSELLPRLPSKLSTVVSSNEDELRASSLRPPSYPLSPSDWTKVLLTKMLAQLISGNEHQLSSSDNVKKCMIGSILLLDDATSEMSELNEAKLITSLRSTGAAVLLTSNRWASGRFADRIVVVVDGSVVESGTHADLLSLGPERSLYARQWDAMSSV